MLRPTLRFAGLCAGLMICANALALSLSDLSQKDATGGLKDALTQGAQLAVKQLGTPGGFSNNPEVKIELPGKLGKVASKMKQFGMGDQVDELEASMNKAAETAVTQAQPILVDAVKKMTVEDLPIVKQATDKVGLAQQYNSFAGQAATMGVVDAKNANVENYVTEQALNGLFEMIGKQEETIRKNPAAAATGLAKKVFGTL
jgi:hypothetical protein